MLGIMWAPPSTWAFHALLNNVAVGALDFSRADGQPTFDCALVVEVLSAVEQVTVALPDGSLTVLCRWRLKMHLQLLQDFIGLVCLEPAGLFIHPRLVLLL